MDPEFLSKSRKARQQPVKRARRRVNIVTPEEEASAEKRLQDYLQSMRGGSLQQARDDESTISDNNDVVTETAVRDKPIVHPEPPPSRLYVVLLFACAGALLGAILSNIVYVTYPPEVKEPSDRQQRTFVSGIVGASAFVVIHFLTQK